MKFKSFYLLEHFYAEGGKALPNVIPIDQKFVAATLKDIQKKILTPIQLKKRGIDWEVIGSAGKKAVASGDLDIAINIISLMKNKKVKKTEDVIPFLQSIIKKNGLKFTLLQGINLLSLAFPVNGAPDQFVQVDLMPTENIDFTIWTNWSPTETESRFKNLGLYRTELLKSVIRSVKNKVVKQFESGETKEVERLFLNVEKGLGKKRISFLGKKELPIKAGMVVDRKFLTKVPIEIIKLIFGPRARLEDTNSFETIWALVTANDFPFKDKIGAIKKDVAKEYEKRHVPIPEEVL